MPEVITGKKKALGDFAVRRVLPQIGHKSVGPFVFFDHLEKTEFAADANIDVRPHPHIGLATITFLFEGELQHKDSLGNDMTIKPGAVNLMTSGKGIVHSERTPQHLRDKSFSLEALQLWVALPRDKEEMEPRFDHFAADGMPKWSEGSMDFSLLMGSYADRESPVLCHSETFYMIVKFNAASQWQMAEEFSDEFAVYVMGGAVTLANDEKVQAGQMIIKGEEPLQLDGEAETTIAIIGGKGLPEKRHIWWNLVSSDEEKIKAAKERWRQRQFPPVPGDEKEFIPLPDES